MNLPLSESAWVPSAKLEEYLLDPDHPTGGAKARFFARLGFTRENAKDLERELLSLARRETVVEESTSLHGTKYVLDGYLEGRRGVRGMIRTVWILETGMAGPRLVTAYPA